MNTYLFVYYHGKLPKINFHAEHKVIANSLVDYPNSGIALIEVSIKISLNRIIMLNKRRPMGKDYFIFKTDIFYRKDMLIDHLRRYDDYTLLIPDTVKYFRQQVLKMVIKR